MSVNEGWIKLHRKILNWEWWDEPITFWVFSKCLLLANHEDNKWHGILVKKGSFISSYAHLASKKAHVSVMQVRTSLNKLKLTGEITVKSNNKYSVITICNWSSYQDNNTPVNKRITSKQHTDNTLITTNKNDKNDKNVKKENSLSVFLEVFNSSFQTKYRETTGREKKLRDRMKTFSLDEIISAAKALSKSKFHTGENDRGWKADPDFLLRSDEQVDKWVETTTERKKKIFTQEEKDRVAEIIRRQKQGGENHG